MPWGLSGKPKLRHVTRGTGLARARSLVLLRAPLSLVLSPRSLRSAIVTVERK
jgi:hypothetical protein